jgi:hypothetical protein
MTKIMYDEGEGVACFYDSARMEAFGPVMQSREDAENYMFYLKVDPMKLDKSYLIAEYWRYKNDCQCNNNTCLR